MAFSISPAVTITEIDATYGTISTAARPGGIAGVFSWGPTMEPILVTSETDLVNRFGKPTNSNYETFFTAADFLSYSDRLYVVRTVDQAAKATFAGSSFEAKYPGALGNAIEVSSVTSVEGYSSVLSPAGTMSGPITFGTKNITIKCTAAHPEFAAGDVLRIGSSAIGYQEVVALTVVDNGFQAGTSTYDYAVTLASPYSLVETSLANLNFERKWKYAYHVATPLKAGFVHIVVADATGEISGSKGLVLESYVSMSTNPSARKSDGTTNYYKAAIENRSNWIAPSAIDLSNSAAPKYHRLSGGGDGSSESAASFASVALGYDKFRNGEEIDLSVIMQGKARGGVSGTGLANYILANIVEQRKDVMLTISPTLDAVEPSRTSSDKIAGITQFRNNVQNSSYWVMDNNYKYRYDKYNDVYRWVPMNGDVAGLMARSEFFESPAGQRRGMIKNVVKLAFNPSKPERDLLYGIDVNPIYTQIGVGTMLFGDKTGLGAESAFNRINVRRVFIEAEKAVATAAAYYLFEFNDEFTRSQFRNAITPWFKNLKGKRGLIDYRIVVDETNNTGEIIDMNIMRGMILLKPAKSINYIEIAFVATKTNVEFEETISQLI